MGIDTAVRASIEKLLEGVQIIGFDWTYLYINEAAERHARRPATDLIGRRMTDCYPGIDQTPMFQALKQRHPGIDTLSMGMSDDFELALSEGATMVRVGSALFGPRG